MKHRLLVYVIGGIGLVIILLLSTLGRAMKSSDTTTHAGHESIPIIQNDSYTVHVDYGNDPVEAGETRPVRFTILRNGQPSDLFGAERMLHVIIASEDHMDFMHTYAPIMEQPHLFRVDHMFTRPGNYRIWVEVDHYAQHQRHGSYADLIAYVDLAVHGAELPIISPPVRSQAAHKENYIVHLSRRTFAAGETASFTLQVEDAHDNTLELFDIEPAIYVIVGPGFSFFQHGHAHGHHGQRNTQAHFTETFPEPGEYLLWSEIMIQQDGQTIEILPVEFILEVK